MSEKLILSKPEADIWIRDGNAEGEALASTTHLAIGAHQDDLEIMAYEGIAQCYESDEKWFAGVVATDGRGSSRTGPYKDFSNEEMRLKRREEQREAAAMGRYAAQLQLDFSSAEVKTEAGDAVVDDLIAIIEATRPDTVYLHQPADKHDTHVALLHRCIQALRECSNAHLPQRILGCEVWRGLDWVDDSEKIAMDCSAYPELAREIVAVFDSQISGGKRYDLGTLGRRCANATYFDARSSDTSDAIAWAIDLKPLVVDPNLSIKGFILDKMIKFNLDVEERVERFILRKNG